MKARLTTASDLHLPYYTHSMMEAVSMCPKWGIIRNVLRLYYRSTYRSMALEAGSAMHDVFAGFRLWTLFRYQSLPEHFKFHGKRLFGLQRFTNCWEERKEPEDELLAFLFNLLNTSGFYDDPDDKIRTMSNLETSTIFYVRRLMSTIEKNPVWVQDRNDPSSLVGIEVPFDIVINEELRVIGMIDGIADRGEYVRPEENKTASRLDDAWREAWRVKHQVVGYKVATGVVTARPINDETRIIGMKLKQTRSHEDMVDFTEYRDVDAVADWERTLYFIHEVVSKYRDAPLDAPMFTHSCNRFFRPCGFVDLCSGSRDDQEDILASMEQTDLSPSEQAILSQYGEKDAE